MAGRDGNPGGWLFGVDRVLYKVESWGSFALSFLGGLGQRRGGVFGTVKFREGG